MKFKCWLKCLLLMLAVPGLAIAQGQGVPHSNYAWGLNGTNAVVILPNATVTVCAGSTVPAAGVTCSPTTTVYNSAALSPSTVASNPMTADAGGNYIFWVSPATSYVISVSKTGYQTYSYAWTAPGGVSPNISDTGSQLNINEPANINGDMHTQGPNPAVDVMRYGGYIGPYYNGGTTGTVSNTTTNGSGSDSLSTTGSLSSNWTVFNGTWAIASGSLGVTCPSNTICLAEWTGTTFQPDQTNTVTMTSTSAASSIGPMVRFTDANNYYFLYINGSTWYLVKNVNGSQASALAHGSHTQTIGDTYSLSAIGTTLTAKINGTTVATVTDTSLSSGQPALLAYSSPTGKINTFAASWSLTTTTVALASALDFQNGQGVNVLAAGPATTLATPTGVVATAQGATGSTTYNYCVVDEDMANGKTACSAAGAISNATATLGIQTVTLTGCARVSGVVTCTTSAPHSFLPGYVVDIPRGSVGNPSFEGSFTTITASGSTFTFNQWGVPDGTAGAGTARTAANILLRWNVNSVPVFIAKHLIYRCAATCTLPANAANYALVGVAVGQDSSFLDMGIGVNVANLDNGDGPATAPTAALNQWLPTTIASGGGTTTLTLATVASNTPSGVKVVHDNALALNAACGAIAATHVGGTILVPAPSSTVAAYYFPISSTWNGCNLDIKAPLWLNAPIVPYGGSTFRGYSSGNSGQTPPFYQLGQVGLVSGNAYPFFLMKLVSSSNVTFTDFLMQCFAGYQPCIEQDEGGDSSAVAAIKYDNVHLQSNGASTPYIAKGGFGFFWNGGGWSSSPGSFAAPPAALFTGNCGFGVQSQLPGIMYTFKTYAFGGILWDSCGQNLLGTDGPTHVEFKELLVEGVYGAAVRYNTGANQFYDITYNNLGSSDYLGGAASPLIDATNATINGLRLDNVLCSNGYGSALETGPRADGTGYSHGVKFDGMGCSYSGIQTSISHFYDYDMYTGNSGIILNTGSKAFYQMAPPPALVSAVVSSGGNVPLGTHTYQLTYSDFEGGETVLGPGITATTTSGNQTVTLTLPATLPAGVYGVTPYRDAVRISNTFPTFTAGGGILLDVNSFTNGASPTFFTSAGITIFSSAAVTAPKVRVNGEVFSASPRSVQNVVLPGALTSTWTGSSWTPDKAITVTRMQASAKTAPVTCAPNAVIRLSDGTTNVNLTVAAASNDSGAISQAYAAGIPLTVSVQTAAAGCRTTPADLNVMIQYRMQ
jgi:hypothetical protein